MEKGCFPATHYLRPQSGIPMGVHDYPTALKIAQLLKSRKKTSQKNALIFITTEKNAYAI
jgi:hypothetical protein